MKIIYVIMTNCDTGLWEPEVAFQKKKDASAWVKEQMDGAPEDVNPDEYFMIEEVELL